MKGKQGSDPWDRDKVRQLFVEYHTTGDSSIRDDLVARYMNLVKFIASKFANRGEPLEDLQQVGYLGLVKAIERFDPDAGAQFTTYATPTIIGEIKRYFRDKGWLLKVPRRLQEAKIAVSRATEQLSYQLGRSPTVREIGDYLKISEEEVLEAQELGQAYNLVSLNYEMESEENAKSSNLIDYLGDIDIEFGNVDNQMLLRRAFTTLNKREQMVTYLRFYENITQSETAKILGISQMHVSRLQSKALEKLKGYLMRDRAVPSPQRT